MGAATGLYAVASQVFPDFGSVPHVILLIGLAVGVDYSLFYLRREREERRRMERAGEVGGHVDAVQIAAATSGRAVVVSGFAVLVSMAGLFLAQDVIFAGLATGAMIVVGVAVIGSVTVLPALLTAFGRAVDRPRVPMLWRLTNRGGEPRLWPARRAVGRSEASPGVALLLRPALRAPRATLLLTLVGMAALAAPALGMSMKNPSEEDLPPEIPVVQAYQRLVAAYPGEGTAHLVAVRAPAGQAGAVREALASLAGRVDGDPLFAPGAKPAIRTSADHTVSTLELPVPFPGDAPQVEQSLERLRTDLVPAAVGPVPSVEYAVGGGAAESLDYTAHQSQRLPWVIGFVVVLTVVMMMAVAFRSVVVALVSGLLNVVSVAPPSGCSRWSSSTPGRRACWTSPPPGTS